MSKENKVTLDLINAELEEKTANLQGLATRLQEAHRFIQENEANAIALNGAIEQLKVLKEKLTNPKKEKLANPEEEKEKK